MALRLDENKPRYIKIVIFMGRTKVSHPSNNFVTPKLGDHLMTVRSRMWKAPHVANKLRFNLSPKSL